MKYFIGWRKVLKSEGKLGEWCLVMYFLVTQRENGMHYKDRERFSSYEQLVYVTK